MEAEVWMLVVTVAIAVIPWAASLHAKVAVIASSVEALPGVVSELRDMLEDHEKRLDAHAAQIEALQKTTGSSR
jgi:hypothetical protein